LSDAQLYCKIYYFSFLGAFAKFAKKISFVMSVRPSVRMEQLGHH